jgi:hypothetical protein
MYFLLDRRARFARTQIFPGAGKFYWKYSAQGCENTHYKDVKKGWEIARENACKNSRENASKIKFVKGKPPFKATCSGVCSKE